VFLFPVVINSVKAAGDLVLLMLAIAGIFIAISEKISPFKAKELKWFSWITTFYFAVAVISVVFSGKFAELSTYLDRDLHFLFASFVALALHKANLNTRVFFIGIKTGLLVVSCIIFYQYFFLDVARPSGMFGQGMFGHIHAILLLLIVVVLTLGEKKILDIFFSFIALSSGLFVLVVNQTRGAWIVFVVGLCLIMIYLYRLKLISIKKFLALVTITFTIMFSISSLQLVQDRTYIAKSDIAKWLDNEKTHTSIGLRLEMYKVGISLIDTLPLTGYGLRNTNTIVSQLSDPRLAPFIKDFNHLHSDILTHYIAKGLLGLISILLLMLIPLVFFIKKMKYAVKENIPPILSGILFCASLLVYSLYGLVFGDVFMNAMYVFFVPILLALVNKVGRPE